MNDTIDGVIADVGLNRDMRRTRLRMRLFVLVLFSLASIAALATEKKARGVILVEYWHVGDDGLSLKLTDEVKKAFQESTDFQLSIGKKPGTLIVEVPENVSWSNVAQRDKLHYKVEFSTLEGKHLRHRKGECWADDLRMCAMQIVKEAKKAASQMR